MVDDMKVARGIYITWLQYVAAVCGCKRWLYEVIRDVVSVVLCWYVPQGFVGSTEVETRFGVA
jgi:hypothetical protein